MNLSDWSGINHSRDQVHTLQAADEFAQGLF
jgi:hypothetical protein